MKWLGSILLVLMFVGTTNASISQLSKEFSSSNIDVLKNKHTLQNISLGYDLLEGTKALSLTTSYTQDDNQLESISQFTPTNTITKTTSVGLNRPFSWGGEFSIENKLVEYDISQWSATQRGTNPSTLFEFKNVLSYSQDIGANFFGRGYRSDLKMADLTSDYSKIQFESINQSLLYEFYMLYLKARLDKTLIYLQEKALNRSIQRKNMIQNRVKDGLNEKVDLYQSQIEVHSQQENLKSYQKDLSDDLSNLSQKLHRQVMKSEISVFSFSKFNIHIPKGKQIDKNIDLQTLKRKSEYFSESVRKARMSYWPTIKLTGSYTANSYDGTTSDAYSNSFPTGENNDTAVVLMLAMPIENQAVRAQVAQAKIQRMSNDMEYRRLIINLENKLRSIDEKVLLLKSNIESSREKRVLAEKALSAMNRLYNLGRADLDRLIGAEEILINTEKSFTSFLMNFDIVMAEREMLQGDLKGFLENMEE